MATTSSPSSPFLRLPGHVRRRIYIYLLAPHAKETVTTINYTLRWPWFENPSNTTFNGRVQIDLCRCPQNLPGSRTRNSRTEDHIYSRFTCYGPQVRFHHGRERLWVCGDEYQNSGQINYLRPGIRYETGFEVAVGILATCRAVYEEAVGFLYRNRNFLFLTGPCPRGRFQAHATQLFLSRLSRFARVNVTCLSIIAVPYEEDANVQDAGSSYRFLASFIRFSLPSFQTLCVHLYNEKLVTATKSFDVVFGKSGVQILLGLRKPRNPYIQYIRCRDGDTFEKALETCTQDKPIPLKTEVETKPSHTKSQTLRRIPKRTTPPKVVPKWEEIEDEAQVDEMISTKNDLIRRLDNALPQAAEGDSLKKDIAIQKDWELADEVSDEEWFDAQSTANAEEWEMILREAPGDSTSTSPFDRSHEIGTW